MVYTDRSTQSYARLARMWTSHLRFLSSLGSTTSRGIGKQMANLDGHTPTWESVMSTERLNATVETD